MKQTDPKEKMEFQQFFLLSAGLCISSPVEVHLNLKSHRSTAPQVIFLEEAQIFLLFIQNESDLHTVFTDKLRDKQVG